MRATSAPRPARRIVRPVAKTKAGSTMQEQVDRLREAFATLSDVLVDELDSLRNENLQKWELVEAHLNKHVQSLRALKAELALARNEIQTVQLASSSTTAEAQEKLVSVQEQLSRLGHEVASQTAAQHVIQLDLTEHKADTLREINAVKERTAQVHQMAERAEASGAKRYASVGSIALAFVLRVGNGAPLRLPAGKRRARPPWPLSTATSAKFGEGLTFRWRTSLAPMPRGTPSFCNLAKRWRSSGRPRESSRRCALNPALRLGGAC